MKKSKKILSVVLALVMVFSAFGAVFMASAADQDYTPDYTNTSKETVEQIIADARTLVDAQLWEGLVNPMLNGSLIQTIYGLYPSLEGFKAIAGLGQFEFTKGSFYKSLDAELFADLDANEVVTPDTEPEPGVKVPGTLTVYFETHPIKADGDAFWTELAKALYPLGTSGMLGGNIAKILIALDNLLVKLGADVPHPSFAYANLDENGVPQKNMAIREVSSVTPNSDLAMAVGQLTGAFPSLTPTQRGEMIIENFGKSMVEQGLTLQYGASENQVAPMVQADADGKVYTSDGMTDHSAVSQGKTITVSVGTLDWSTFTIGEPYYDVVLPNPFEGKANEVSGRKELTYADGTAADASKLPAKVNEWGEVCDSDGKILYTGGSTPLSVPMDGEKVAAGITDYLSKILPVLQQDTVGTLLAAVRAFSDPAGRVAFHEFAVDIQRSVGIMTALAAAMGQINVEGYNLGALMVSLQFFLNEFDDMTEEVTVNGETKTATDFDEMLNYITTKMNILPAKNADGSTKLDENDNIVLEPLGITLSAIDWSKLSTDMDDADTLMVVYHYLFNNLVGNKANLNKIAALLEGFGLSIGDYLGLVQSMDANALLTFVAPILHNMVYPAIIDEESGVKVEVGDSTSTIAPGAVIAYETLTEGDACDAMIKALKEADVEYNKIQVFDLKLMKGEEEIQPDGSIKVSIPVPEGFDAAKCAIYRMEADGSLTRMDVTVEEGYLVFVTDHLSQYAIVELNEVVNPGTDDPGKEEPKPGEEKPGASNTGDAVIGAVAMVTVAAGAAFVLSRKKKA